MPQPQSSVASGRKYHFTVDEKKFESDVAVLTGQQIKTKAGADPTHGLFLEGHGKHPDRQIRDDEQVDLSEPGNEDFFTAPPANFGNVG
jgi:hypothetical protein